LNEGAPATELLPESWTGDSADCPIECNGLRDWGQTFGRCGAGKVTSSEALVLSAILSLYRLDSNDIKRDDHGQDEQVGANPLSSQ